MSFIDDAIDRILVISAVIFLFVGVVVGVIIGNPHNPYPLVSIFVGFALLGYAWKREGKGTRTHTIST